MAKKGKPTRGRKSRRQTYVFVGKKKRTQIRELSRYVPSLKKLRGKSRITSAEAAQLTRAKKRLRHTENLRIVTDKQAKILKKKGLLAGHGVQAIRLRSTAENAKIRVTKSGMVITSNGRTFEYHPVKPDIDALAAAGERLLERSDVATIYLWTNRGRTDEGFTYFHKPPLQGGWLEYLQQRFQQYHAVNDFVEGIAAEIRAAKGKGKSIGGKK